MTELIPSGHAVIDEGDLQIRMAVAGVGKERTLVVDWGKDISWMAFTKETGAEFARLFLERLAQL